VKKYLLPLMIIVLSLNSCLLLSNRILEGAVYVPFNMNTSLKIGTISFEDQNGLELSIPVTKEILDAKFRQHGFNLNTDAETLIEVKVYEKPIHSSLKGEKSLSAVLSLKQGDTLIARVLYTSEQATGLDSDRLLFMVLDGMVKELEKIIANQEI